MHGAANTERLPRVTESAMVARTTTATIAGRAQGRTARSPEAISTADTDQTMARVPSASIRRNPVANVPAIAPAVETA